MEVTEGSPAFLADVLPGDVVLAIADQPIQSPEHMIRVLDKYEGQLVTLRIDRDGKALEKQLQIRTYKRSSQ